MTQRPLHVLIAGGGLSGLCLAQGLLKDGHTCEVFERDADLSRKRGYYLHMNADGGEALRRCLPGDLFDPSSIFVIPFGYLDPAPAWTPSRVTLIGDAAHAMLPTLGMGANLALRDASRLLEQLTRALRDETGLVASIGAFEQDMRDYVYPFMRMTMDHDRNFGGGALEQMG